MFKVTVDDLTFAKVGSYWTSGSFLHLRFADGSEKILAGFIEADIEVSS